MLNKVKRDMKISRFFYRVGMLIYFIKNFDLERTNVYSEN